ncbi:MAG: ComEC/Rec2 family competence protein [Clostridia bacterium]|nr:ComEC/Rec2 family competence protein [Clostridia bacterium]
MNLFDKRPLCMILCILLGGFIFFSEANKSVRLVLLAFSIIILVLTVYLFISKITKTKLYIVSASALLLSYLLSFLYFNLYFNAYERFEGEVTITGTVEELDERNGGYSVTVECSDINGTRYSSSVNAFISYDDVSCLSEGNTVEIKGILRDFDIGTNSDSRSYNRANGISSRITDITSISVTGVSDTTIGDYLREYRRSIASFIIENSDREGGGLLTALLLGEREYLSDSTRLSYKRAGLSHTLALSVMHLAILSFALNRLLLLFGISKKPRKIIEITFVIAYMALTGFPVSVVRAGVMLIISSLLYLFAEKSDSITTLSLAVALICLFSPESVYDISLWLSAFATLGLLIYIELKENEYKKPRKRRIFGDMLASVVISLFAIGATMLTTFLSFDAISIAGPLTSPLFSLLIQIFIYIGLLFIAFGHIWGLGDLIAYLGGLINRAINAVSSFDGIYVSTSGLIVKIFIYVFTALAVIFLVFKIKRRRLLLLSLGTVLIFIYGTAYLNYIDATNDEIIDYTVCDTDERFFLSSKGDMTLIEVSDNGDNNAYEAVEFIRSYGTHDIDNLMITSYNGNVSNYIHTVTGSVYVDKIYLPAPLSNNEVKSYNEILNNSQNASYKIVCYDTDDFLDFGEHTVTMTSRFDSLGYDRFSLLFLTEAEAVAYVSSGMFNDETKSVATDMINGADSVIFGRHGDKYNDYSFILKIASIKRMIISSLDFDISANVRAFYKDTEIITGKEAYSFIR